MTIFKRRLPSGVYAYSPYAILLHRVCDAVWAKDKRPKWQHARQLTIVQGIVQRRNV